MTCVPQQRNAKIWKNKMKNKKMIVIIPESIDKKVPDEIREEFEKTIKDLADGKIVGQKVKLKKCKKKLICPRCNSDDVSWVLDVNSNEVYFNCFDCKECFWETKKEYNNAVKRHPEYIIKERKNGSM